MGQDDKVKKAAEILTKFGVAKNLNYLLNDVFPHGVESVQWDLGIKPNSVPNGYRVKKFTYNGRTFLLTATNKRGTHSGEQDWSDFELSVDGEVVLRTVLETYYDEWATDSVSISPILLKLVKLGDWMDDLAVVVQRSQDSWEATKRRLEEERQAEQASQIDLGSYE